MAMTIMNIGPGLEALMNDGQMIPARYPTRTPITPTMTPG